MWWRFRAQGRAGYEEYRSRLGRGILLGLEFLAAVEPTFRSGVLALVVLARTFLSFTLQVEMTGRWPWNERKPDQSPEAVSGRSS